MPRIVGVDVPGKKRVDYALRYIHGIGPARANEIVASCNIDAAKHADDLTAEEIRQIIGYIQEHYRVEGDLRREVSQNIRRLISTGSYRGQRHRKGLPVRGQRTRTNARTNARTRKGAKKTVSAVRDKEERKAMKAGA